MTTIDSETTGDADTAGAARFRGAAATATTDRQVNHKLAAVPTCGNCKTDTYLFIEDFTPAAVNDEGQLLQLPQAGYFCTRCLGYAAHAVPPMWTPEGRGR